MSLCHEVTRRIVARQIPAARDEQIPILDALWKRGFTECCNHCFQLTRELLKVYTDHVSPQVWALKDDNLRTDTPRDTAIAGTYRRVEMWLHSVTKLNQTLDAQ